MLLANKGQEEAEATILRRMLLESITTPPACRSWVQLSWAELTLPENYRKTFSFHFEEFESTSKHLAKTQSVTKRKQEAYRNGFSPVWVRMCFLRSLSVVKYLLQPSDSQLNVFPV